MHQLITVFRSTFYSPSSDEDQIGLSSQAIPKDLGTIRIELHHIKSIGGSGKPPVRKLGVVSTMSEKSKSIGFHTVSYVHPVMTSNTLIEVIFSFLSFSRLRPPEINTDSCNVTNVTYVDHSKPWFTVKFFYRPLGLSLSVIA